MTAAGKAYDEEAWRRLWELSEELTGVHYEFPTVRARHDGVSADEAGAS